MVLYLCNVLDKPSFMFGKMLFTSEHETSIRGSNILHKIRNKIKIFLTEKALKINLFQYDSSYPIF